MITVLDSQGQPAPSIRAVGWISFGMQEGIVPIKDSSEVSIRTDAAGAVVLIDPKMHENRGYVWLLDEERKQRALLLYDIDDLGTEMTVSLGDVYTVDATAHCPQADELGVPFVRRGYLYTSDGRRIAHIVGKNSEMYLPEGTYRQGNYDGNPTAVLTGIPSFSINFTINPERETNLEVETGTIHSEPAARPEDPRTIDLGRFDYGESDVAFPAGVWNPDLSGELDVSIQFHNYTDLPQTTGNIIVRNGSYDIVYYGAMPADGLLELKGVRDSGARGYQIEVDQIVPAGGRDLDFEVLAAADGPHVIQLPPMVGDRLDDVWMVDPTSGERVSLADYRGQAVYIDIWASWCGPCIGAMNHLQEQFGGEMESLEGRLTLVALNIEGDQSQVEQAKQQYGWDIFEHLSGADGALSNWEAPIMEVLGLRGIPHAVLLDAEGRIYWRGHPGTIDLEAAVVDIMGE